MNRLENNQCLWCGEKQVRTDGFPLCSVCQRKADKKMSQLERERLAVKRGDKKTNWKVLNRKKLKTKPYIRPEG